MHAMLRTCVVLVLTGWVFGQEPDDEKPSPLMAEARQRLNELTLTRTDPGKAEPTSVAPVEKPLLKFGDEERGVDFGVLWAWGKSGRPEVVVEMFRFGGDSPRWWYGLVRIGERSVEMKVPALNPVTWKPPSPNASFKTLEAAEAPDGLEEVRLKQMRAIAARFTAESYWQEQNETLKVQADPIHLYKEEAGEITNGGLFAICHGTNPELLLFVEAVKDDLGSRWRYAIARCGAAEFRVAVDGKEVLRIERFERFGEPDVSAWFGQVKG